MRNIGIKKHFVIICALLIYFMVTCFKDKITNPQFGTLALTIHFPTKTDFSSSSEGATNWRVANDFRSKKVISEDLREQNQEAENQHMLPKANFSYSYVKALIIRKNNPDTILLKVEANNLFVLKKDIPAGKIDTIRVIAFAQDETIIAKKDTINFIVSADRSNPVSLHLKFVSGVERCLEVDSISDRQVPVNFASPPPIIARVLDAYGNNAKMGCINFSIQSGDATFNNNERQLECPALLNGQAIAYWRSGQIPGNIRFLVSASDRSGDPLDGSPVVLDFTALPRGVADSLTLCPFMDWHVNICDTLNEPLCVKVLDLAGDGVVSATVNFSILSNNAHFANGKTAAKTLTDSEGRAFVQATIGSEPGEVRIRVETLDDSSRNLAGSPLEFDVGINVNGIADSLVYISGDNQTGVVNDTLPNQILIRIVDYFGEPLTDWQTDWQIVAGNAVFLNSEKSLIIQTDSRGQARANIRVIEEGSITIRINCRNKCGAIINSPRSISATGVPVPPDRLIILRGPGLHGTACDSLSEQIAVQRIDAQDRGVAEKEILMHVLSDSAEFFDGTKSVTFFTNADGYVQTNVRLGFSNGAIGIVASSFDENDQHIIGSPASFSVMSDASGIVDELTKQSGDGQSGYTGTVLPVPLSIEAVDLLQHPVANQNINFSVLTGNASFDNGLEQIEVRTDAYGLSQTQLILGNSPGVVNVEASFTNQCATKDSVIFSATIKAFPDSLKIIQGPGLRGSACDTLDRQIILQRVDADGHGVAGQTIRVSILSDSAQFFDGSREEILTTNDSGKVFINLRLGLYHGAIYLSASSTDRQGSHISGSPQNISVSSDAKGVVASLQKLRGDNQSGYPGDTLSVPLSVQALDLLQNPAANKNIHFQVVSGTARFISGDDQMDVLTDLNGRAHARLVLGDSPGLVNVQASLVNACTFEYQRSFSATILPPPLPSISAIEPVIAVPNELVNVYGKNFLFDVSNVWFDGVSASFQVVNDGLIQARVPVGATSGPVEIKTDAGRSTTSPPFYVLELYADIPVLPDSHLVDMRANNSSQNLYIADAASVIFQVSNFQSPIVNKIRVDSISSIATIDIASTGTSYDELLIYSNNSNGELYKTRSDISNNAQFIQRNLSPLQSVYKMYCFNNGGVIVLCRTDSFVYCYNFSGKYNLVRYIANGPLNSALINNKDLYITNSGASEVSIYQLANSSIPLDPQGTITVGNYPHDIIANSGGNIAYVSNRKDGTISVISLQSRNLIAEIAAPPLPTGMKLSKDERFLFCASEIQNTITVIDLMRQDSIVRTIPVGTAPDIVEHIDTNNARYFFVLNRGTSTISMFAVLD